MTGSAGSASGSAARRCGSARRWAISSNISACTTPKPWRGPARAITKALDEVEGAIIAAATSNTRSDQQRPSMGQDMLKGRRTEIDFINGLIAGKGAEVGVPAPTHLKLIAAVKEVEHGKRAAAPENLFGI